MDPFSSMKDCLKEFNYPGIQGMDDADIIDLFSKTNRCFLVAWIFKQIDEDYCAIVDEASKEDLADMIGSNGFCSDSEKGKFMNAECEHSLQMSILYKMFQYLKSASNANKDPNTASLSIEEIDALVQLDTNLFPTYGPKKTLTPSEQTDRINKYREEIEEMKKLIALNGKRNDNVDSNLKNQLKLAMEQLDENFSPFEKKVLDTMKNNASADANDIVFGEDFEDMLEKCGDSLKTVLKFIQSLNVVTNFKENDPEVNVADNKSHSMIRELAELCKEITNLKKE